MRFVRAVKGGGRGDMRTARLKQRICVLLGVTVLAVVGTPLAHAGTSASPSSPCPGETMEHPFVLDPFTYTLVPGGTFENGAPGWTLNGGARVVAGNEPFYAHGTGELYSLY